MSLGWSRATHRERCTLCDGANLCGWSNDGRVRACLRNFYEEGAIIIEEKLGTTAYYFTDQATRDRWRERPRESLPPIASPDELSLVYNALLDELRLSSAHANAFLDRGLTRDHIDRARYRSMAGNNHNAILRILESRFGQDLLVTVPGFFVENRCLRLASPMGIWIPVRDAQARIRAIRVRLDKPLDDDRKYGWLTSAHKKGPSPSAPAHAPIFGSPRNGIVRVTEGELKADIATVLSGIYTTSIPGATLVLPSVPMLRDLGATTVWMGWDADKSLDRGLDSYGKQKRNGVAAGLEHALHLYEQENFACEVEDWPAEAGKGIDDVYRAGTQHEITRHRGQDAWDLVLKTLHSAKNNPRTDTLERVHAAARLAYGPAPEPEQKDDSVKWMEQGDVWLEDDDFMPDVEAFLEREGKKPDGIIEGDLHAVPAETEQVEEEGGGPIAEEEFGDAPQALDTEPATEPEEPAKEGGLLAALRLAAENEKVALEDVLAKKDKRKSGGDSGDGGGKKRKGGGPPPPRQPGAFERGDEMEMAERLMVDLKSGHLAVDIAHGRPARPASDQSIIYDRNDFWRHDPVSQLWIKLESDDVFLQVGSYAGSLYYDDENTPTILKLSRTKITGTVDIAKNMGRSNARAIEPMGNFFDRAPCGVALQDVFLRISGKTGDLFEEPLSAAHRQTVSLPFSWDRDADRYATKWQTFYEEVFANCPIEEQNARASALDEIAGACLFGVATYFQQSFLLTGEGSNGKSTWLKVIRALFPSEFVCSISPQELLERFAMSTIVGKRLNLVAELPVKAMHDSNKIKSVISGDELNVEYKGKDFAMFIPLAGHIYAANALPKAADPSDGFWRRFVIVAFEMQFTGDAAKVNYHEELLTEIQGIFARCVKAVQRLIRRKRYLAPQSSLDGLEEWKSDSDQVHSFIASCCVRDAAARTKLSLLYAAYERWSGQTGHGKMSDTSLAKSLKAKGLKGTDENGKHYRLALRPNGPAGTLAKKVNT